MHRIRNGTQSTFIMVVSLYRTALMQNSIQACITLIFCTSNMKEIDSPCCPEMATHLQ